MFVGISISIGKNSTRMSLLTWLKLVTLQTKTHKIIEEQSKKSHQCVGDEGEEGSSSTSSEQQKP